ncbi:MAG TPA: 2Fe-2S iron-sulfur cluster-binding protein [Woeseiaceae bacterium]|jgi:ring-1,2-phenylacetyl-CoA epoxidase subunit PaaE|nr:2Fe-2S iron-sulfur cluster-binding protein [Woeseiaceae bacterium]
MKQFHDLTVTSKTPESKDALRIALDVPEDLREVYAFLPGQHLPIQIERDGKKLRRTYSICSPAGSWPLQIGVRIQPGGAFGEFAANELAVGDTLAVMPPTGRFHLAAERADGKFHIGFAAGSGITPILSIAASVLEREPHSRFALFYGNRKQNTTMFIDDLFALKNRFPERLQLHFVFSREEQEFEISGGRLDADKAAELYQRFCSGDGVDEAWICGPDSMIESVAGALIELGLGEGAVHSERFGVPRGTRAAPEAAVSGDVTQVTVIMDGHRKSFAMPRSGTSIVDAAAEQGLDLPYSCKGGVCATCRCHLRKGEVEMAVNYGLEPWEVEKGFVLACQSTPRSDEILLDYDKS